MDPTACGMLLPVSVLEIVAIIHVMVISSFCMLRFESHHLIAFAVSLTAQKLNFSDLLFQRLKNVA